MKCKEEKLIMGQIEREIKLLNVDVMKIKNTLHEKGLEPKGKYIHPSARCRNLPRGCGIHSS